MTSNVSNDSTYESVRSCWCSTLDNLDWRQVSNFAPLPIAKVLAILKEKMNVNCHQVERQNAKVKKESQKKRKFTFSEFQTLTRFSSREAFLVGLNLYTIGVVALSKGKWARPFISQILEISKIKIN